MITNVLLGRSRTHPDRFPYRTTVVSLMLADRQEMKYERNELENDRRSHKFRVMTIKVGPPEQLLILIEIFVLYRNVGL